MDMVCWSEEKIAFLAQNYFLGSAIGAAAISLPEIFGRHKLGLYFLAPMCLIGYILQAYINNYKLKSLGFFIEGLVHVKFSCFIVNCIEQSSKNY